MDRYAGRARKSNPRARNNTTIVSATFRLLLIALLISAADGCATRDDDSLSYEYRGWPYKAPTPLSVPGATTLFFAEDVEALIDSSELLLVNVSPITLSPADADGNRSWIPKRGKIYQQIPGSIWLPNVGYQELAPAMTRYFANNLHRHSGGDKSRRLLFYCTADCWMSWNSVIRARQEFGYQNIYWYPYGIDGWKEQNLEVETAVPVPFATALD